MHETKEYDHLIDRIYAQNKTIMKKLKRKGVDENDISDLAVKIMLDAVAAVHQLREEDKLESWLMKIVRSGCSQYFKERSERWGREVSHITDMETGDEIDIYDTIADEMTVERIVRSAEETKVLGKLLEKLSEKERQVFLMHNLDGYKFREIAELLNMNDNTVRSHHRRALIKMETYLEKLKGKEENYDR